MSVLAGIFLGVGILFDLIGCIGLMRLPDVYNRLQAATKCVTLGTGLILFGVFLNFGFSATGIKALLCLAFIFMASPTAAHALARGAYRYGVRMWSGSVCDKYIEEEIK